MTTLKKVLALSLALMMVLSVTSFAAFTDSTEIVPECKEAVDVLTALNVIKGYTDNSFKPNNTITRAEAAKMMYVICNAGVDDGAKVYVDTVSTFTDIAGNWANGYISYCYGAGLISGRTATIFDPNAPITGYELAKMLLTVAKYRIDAQGYTGADWAKNVMRDAEAAGLLDGYNVLLKDAAPRQWACLMMYNLIMKVEIAQYIGDMLVTNSGLSSKGQTVGEYRMKLFVKTGVALSNGNSDVFSNVTGNTLITNYDEEGRMGNQFSIDYYIPSALLGQEVSVVAMIKNASLTGAAREAAKNLKVLSVYPTGTSTVYETTFNAITATLATDDDDNFTGKISIKFAGYNEGKAKTHTVANLVLCGADFSQLTFADLDELDEFLGANSGDKVRAIDTDGDGLLDAIVIYETEYFTVSRLTSAKLTTSGGSYDVEDVNLIDTPAKGDVIAVNYNIDTELYDVRVIEGEKLTVKSRTTDGTNVTSINIDGTSYKLAANAVGGYALSEKSVYYYIDQGFVVYGTDTAGTAAKLSDSYAILTGIGTTSEFSDSFNVRYLGLDGKTNQANYLFDTTNAIGGTTIALAKTALGNVRGTGDILALNTKTSGVYFKGGASLDKTPFVLVEGSGAFTFTTDVQGSASLSQYFSPTAKFFIGYALDGDDLPTKYAVKNAADVGDITANCTIGDYVVNGDTGEIELAYIILDAATIPPVTTVVDEAFAIITGRSYIGTDSADDEYLFVDAIVISDGKIETKTLKIDADDTSDFDSDYRRSIWVVETDKDGVSTLDYLDPDATDYGFVKAIAGTGTYFTLGDADDMSYNARYYVDSKTVYVDVVGWEAELGDGLVLGDEEVNDTIVIYSTSGAKGTATYVFTFDLDVIEDSVYVLVP